MNNKLTFVLGIGTGIVMGWVLGILSAPQAGRDTLDSIGGKAIELRDWAGDATDRVIEGMVGPLTSTAGLDADYTR
jgi:gas vesicle protein